MRGSGGAAQRELCEAAFWLFFPAPVRAAAVSELEAHTAIWRSFRAKLDAEAYLDAALMLVQEGWNRWAVTGRHSATVGRDGDVTTQDSWVFAAHPRHPHPNGKGGLRDEKSERISER